MSPFRLVFFNTERDGLRKRTRPTNDGFFLVWRPYDPPAGPFLQIFLNFFRFLFYFKKKNYVVNISCYFSVVPPVSPLFSLCMSLLLTTRYRHMQTWRNMSPIFIKNFLEGPYNLPWPNVRNSSATGAIISAQAHSLVWEFVWSVDFSPIFSSGGRSCPSKSIGGFNGVMLARTCVFFRL